MLQRVKIDGVQLPKLYVAENMADVQMATENGLPYIKWRHGMDELLRQLLRPVIEKMFPGIQWNKVLGRRKKFSSDVIMVPGAELEQETVFDRLDFDASSMLKAQHEYDNVVNDLDHGEYLPDDMEYSRTVDIAEDIRDCPNDNSDLGYHNFMPTKLRIEDYIGDISSNVNIDVLQQLGMLPKFVGDIADCIRFNLSENMRWKEGYTKKLGVPLGNFTSKKVLPNLLIIDISHSIPDGIAATMLTLADTLRSQCNAELIITSARSGYYPIGCDLPKPQTLRDYYGRSNEAYEFKGILEKYIAGREYGHIISFGDNDNPGFWCKDITGNLKNVKVHEIHHYHTMFCNTRTGYARWASLCCPNAVEHFNTEWCKVMKRNIL